MFVRRLQNNMGIQFCFGNTVSTILFPMQYGFMCKMPSYSNLYLKSYVDRGEHIPICSDLRWGKRKGSTSGNTRMVFARKCWAITLQVVEKIKIQFTYFTIYVHKKNLKFCLVVVIRLQITF